MQNFGMEETVFDYKLEEIESACLNLQHPTKDSYLINTTPSKRLGELYTLFSMRQDKGNCQRIADMINNLLLSKGKV
jgi:hypothetical protein